MFDHRAVSAALDQLKLVILSVLAEEAYDGWCMNLHGLSSRTEMPREVIRGLATELRKDGCIQHQNGLWREDGTSAGSGYFITKAGRLELARLSQEGTQT